MCIRDSARGDEPIPGPAWVLGEVGEEATWTPQPDVEGTRGAKGVDGGAVQVVGEHPKP